MTVPHDEFGFCGCGKPVRYFNPKTGGGSCSKGPRCLSYDELRDELAATNLKLMEANIKIKKTQEAFTFLLQELN